MFVAIAVLALGAVAAAWWGVLRASAVRRTTLVAARGWLLGGLAVWTTALGATLAPGVAAGWCDQLWYAAAVAMLCPPVAVLGARRPGAAAWNGFVLIPLLIVMEWPALAQWRASGAPDRVVLELPTVLGFALVLTMGCGNYFGTRFTLATGFYAASLLVVVLPAHWRTGIPEAGLEEVPPWEGVWGSLLMLGALLRARRADRLHHAFDASLSEWDRVWLDFRDFFGIVWAKRVMDRINEAAREERWPMRLSLAGFEAAEGEGMLDAVQAEERRAHWMRFLLKRFVDPEWISARLG